MFDSASVNCDHKTCQPRTEEQTSTNLHLVHAFLSIPVQERLPLEHGSELVADTLEQLLDGG